MIGFIGLGIMGRPMARNLINAGYDLLLGGRHPERFEDVGAPTATYRQIGERCSYIILMVTDGNASKEVLFGAGGLAETMRPGTIVLDMSSALPTDSVECCERLSAIGVNYLDAPVSGGEVGAIDGTLVIMAGGDRTAFDKCRPILNVLGKSAVYIGESGSGSVAKLVNQMIVHNTIACLGEAFAFAKRAGADPAVVFDAIRGGFAGSTLMEQKLPKILDRDFKPGGMMQIGLKDVRNAVNTAKQMEFSAPLTMLTCEIMEKTGRSREDHTAIVKYFEDINGVEIRSETPCPAQAMKPMPVRRTWGTYQIIETGDGCQSKILRVDPGQRVSLQSHCHRSERWMIMQGHALVQVDDVFTEAGPGDVFGIPVGAKHRITNTSSDASLVFAEVQLGDYLGEDDIIRY